jgi:hypothetical protein
MQLSAIVIGFLLVGLVSASNPGGYWTVYSSQECSSGTEILYSWFNAFPDTNDYYLNNISCTQLGSTSQYYTFAANVTSFDLSMFEAGNGWNLYITPSDCIDAPVIADFTAIKVGESCTAFEIWNGVGGEQFPTSFNFTECPASGNATYLTFSTFDCTDGATQTISGPSGECYRDFNDYPRLIYCDNYVSASTPQASPSSDAPISAPISTPTTATPTRTPTATPAKKSDATLISLGLTTLVMAVASAV